MYKQFTHITRLLLLICLLVAQWSMTCGPQERLFSHAADTHQTSDQEEESPTVQEWFVTNIAPSQQFHFDEVHFDWPTLTWRVAIRELRPSASPQGNYSLGFFAKIFERLIAINAP